MKKFFRLMILAALILAAVCARADEQAEIPHYEAGSIVTFGRYEQDGNPDNGAEKIEWIVLDTQDGKCLLLSRYCLDVQPYQSKDRKITWKDSSLRKWLNGDFLNTAFQGLEQELIPLKTVNNSKKQGYKKWTKTKGGKNTKDRVFLLSCAEAEKYLGVTYGGGQLNPAAQAEPTAYAVGKGAYCETVHEADGTEAVYAWWWLRSPGYVQNAAAGVGGHGTLLDSGAVWEEACVRPAIWVKLDERTAIYLEEKPLIERKTSGDYTYTVLENGTAEITRYSGKDETAVIPDALDGHPVTAIGEEAFMCSSSLTSVVIPNGVTAIGDYAFYACRSMASVTIPAGVKDFGEFVFYMCKGLTSVTLKDGCAAIPGFMFCDCKSLVSIEIPDSVRSIGVRAFWACSSLASVEVPDGVTSIGTEAFGDCENLVSVTIPDSVSSVGASPFTSCGALEEIRISGDHPYLDMRDGVLFSKADHRLICFTNAFAGGAYTVPDGTAEIDERAFWGCDTLTSITLPDSMTTIREEVFGYCTGLESARIPESVTLIGDNTFYGCPRTMKVTVDRGSYAEKYCKKNKLKRAY